MVSGIYCINLILNNYLFWHEVRFIPWVLNHLRSKKMIRRNLAAMSFLAVVLLSGLGLTAFATDSPQVIAAVSVAGETLDSVLGDKVETLLRTDIGLAGSQFRVQSKSGIVTVGGSVPDEYSLRRALDLVSGVRGVREVHNAMEIDSPK
jgi:hypothetical protein